MGTKSGNLNPNTKLLGPLDPSGRNWVQSVQTIDMKTLSSKMGQCCGLVKRVGVLPHKTCALMIRRKLQLLGRLAGGL